MTKRSRLPRLSPWECHLCGEFVGDAIKITNESTRDTIYCHRECLIHLLSPGRPQRRRR